MPVYVYFMHIQEVKLSEQFLYTHNCHHSVCLRPLKMPKYMHLATYVATVGEKLLKVGGQIS